MSRKKLYAVDGNSMIYRACFSPSAELTSPTGEPTKGTYIFMKMLWSLLDEKPDYLAIAFDAPKSTNLRKKAYPEYKGNRTEEGKEDLFRQMDRIEQIISLLGIRTIRIPGYEADDVLATLAERYANKVDVRLVSSDKDLHQCVRGEEVVIWDSVRRERLTAHDVSLRWGVGPRMVQQLQALVGDSTDNIPGVRGVGMKKALELISTYGFFNLKRDGVLEEMTPKLREMIRATDLDLMLFLTTLAINVPLKCTLKDLRWVGPNLAAASPVFAELGFKRWVASASKEKEAPKAKRKARRLFGE